MKAFDWNRNKRMSRNIRSHLGKYQNILLPSAGGGASVAVPYCRSESTFGDGSSLGHRRSYLFPRVSLFLSTCMMNSMVMLAYKP